MKTQYLGCLLVFFPLAACGGGSGEPAAEIPGETGGAGGGGSAGDGGGGSSGSAGDGGGGTAGSAPLPGELVVVELEPGKRVHVDLDTASVVEADAGEGLIWDLAFEGWDVFTNSGPSGAGQASGFGPLGLGDFTFPEKPTLPEFPFLSSDETGGAFLSWYAYDGSSHVLYSRFHHYGIKSGDRTYKLQIEGYYGEVQGAPLSAVYQLRYADVTDGGTGTLQEIDNLNAIAGGPAGDETAPSNCLVLATAEQLLLTQQEARASTAWDLCFRRDAISINGELGGPGTVSAVNLQELLLEEEELADVVDRTAENQLQAFLDVTLDDLNDPSLVYRGDRVVSIFSDAWLDFSLAEPQVAAASWVVLNADAERYHLVAFEPFAQPSANPPSLVRLRVRTVEN